MAWCGYSQLWWNRAYIQLAGQALTKVQTLSLGELFARWHMIEEVCATHGCRIAKELDAETWRRAVAAIESGATFDAKSLAVLDNECLQKVKGRAEAEKKEAPL